MKKAISSLYILVAAVLWGCIGLFYKELASLGMSSSQVVLFRVGTAAVLMLLYILVKNKKLLYIRLKDCWLFIGSGVFSLAFFNFCYFKTIDILSPSVASVLLYTAPVFVMVFSIVLFKEKLTLVKALALAITIVGCILMTEVFKTYSVSAIGILFGIGSGVGYALYTIFGVVALKRYSTETITFYTFVFATIGVLPFCDLPSLCAVFQTSATAVVHGSIMIGFFSCLLPYALYTAGLRVVSPSTASVMATLEPVVASFIGFICLDECVSAAKIIGIAMIVLAIIVLNVQGLMTTIKNSCNT